jgi:hypothetical protein
MKKKLACKSCGGATKMKNGGEKPKKSFQERRNDKAVAQGYPSLAAKKDSRAQNAITWSGIGSSLLGTLALGKELFEKKKKGGTTKRKVKR